MHATFAPDMGAVGPIEFRPFMLEVAWDYCQTVLQSKHQRGLISQAIGALAIEIVLKSFNATVDGNKGELTETYKFNGSVLPPKANAHNLKHLMEALRPDVRAYLLSSLQVKTILEHQDAFSKSRYIYEPSAPTSASGEPMKLAVELICKAVYLYKQRGCGDRFIAGFNVDAAYFHHVQQVLLFPGEA